MTQMKNALNELDDNRIKEIKPLIPPQILMEDLPLSEEAAVTVSKARAGAQDIIKGTDDRLLVIVGPCSIHDTQAALEYAARLKAYADETNELLIVMRVYFEKPRTSVGWKGLINDPNMDGTFLINNGLRIARKLLLNINALGMPAGVEYLDTITPQFIGDLVSWGAIGARTTESQIHRELASGLSAPVGFKNGTDGNVHIAIDAIRAASQGHHFLSVTKQGLSAIVATNGNDSCHVILRGSTSGPNYSQEHVARTSSTLEKSNVNSRVMVDCSHGNSEKQHKKQINVITSICDQLKGETRHSIMGVMIESNINEGKQSIPSEGPKALKYGVSITDACLGWDDTIVVLNMLKEAVKARRV